MNSWSGVWIATRGRVYNLRARDGGVATLVKISESVYAVYVEDRATIGLMRTMG
jgi:hypothetical protein